MVALNAALSSSCELGFEKYYEQLNAHVHACGPQPPLLIIGNSGIGRSLLLAKWTQLHQEKYPSSLVMCHFVGSESSVGADAILMIRRLTAQLMQHVTSPPALTCNPVRLEEEFPRWLEKVSSRLPGGVVLVLDSIDLFQQAELHLKWLLDPLPVGVHVIASVNEKTCPQSWRQWATLYLEPLSKKNVKELLRAELALFDIRLSMEDEAKILNHCQTEETCAPLFIMVLVRHIVWTLKHEGQLTSYLDTLLTCQDCVDLYVCVIDKVQSLWEIDDVRQMMMKVLKLLYVSRNGLNENELLALVPGLTWPLWTSMFNALTDQLVTKYQTGLVMPAHLQTSKALYKFFQTEIFLKNCILNLCVFQRLYARGRCAELISYWQLIGADKTRMAQAYLTQTKYMEEVLNQSNLNINISGIADMHELAEPLKRRALIIKKKTRGPRISTGQIRSIDPMVQRRALQLEELAMGPDSADLAHTLNELGVLYYLQSNQE
ncbi:NPHP3 [Acanthosepion pharaonis]|uniref:NPHP3 n=1 Tax=Acanthosepion pharaonis TaxID=158019 RepID=A0A812CZU0_ACAPH|nr:NPHP3 [Sepia pharaonis]